MTNETKHTPQQKHAEAGHDLEWDIIAQAWRCLNCGHNLPMVVNQDLLEELYRALPFLEDVLGCTIYKPGVVRERIKAIRAVLAKAEQSEAPKVPSSKR